MKIKLLTALLLTTTVIAGSYYWETNAQNNNQRPLPGGNQTPQRERTNNNPRDPAENARIGSEGRATALPISASAAGNNLFLVQGNTIIKFNAETMEEVKRVNLPSPTTDANAPPRSVRAYRTAYVTATSEFVFVIASNNIHKYKADTLELVKTKALPQSVPQPASVSNPPPTAVNDK